MRDSRRLRIKTLFFALIAVCTNVFGNYFLSLGVREPHSSYLDVFSSPWMFAGILLLAIWLVSQLSLLSWADLSYVLPVTASSYVLTALVGALLCNEYVSTVHWVGIVLIFTGVIVVGQTSPQTVPVHSEVDE